jgi:hypothetical protein
MRTMMNGVNFYTVDPDLTFLLGSISVAISWSTLMDGRPMMIPPRLHISTRW